MERELLITGIGGQGVQLAAQVLARAADARRAEVMYLGLYGGMMRGGNTDSTVVIGRRPDRGAARRVADVVGDRDARRVLGAGRAQAPPRRPRARERRDVHHARSRATSTVLRVAATNVATELGNPLGARDGDARRVRRDHGHRRARRARRGDAAVDPAVPHATHRSERSERSAPGWDLLPANAHPGLGEDARRMPETHDPARSRAAGTVTIDVEHCKGCDLCIPACPPGVLAMSAPTVNHMGYRYPELYPGCTGCAACCYVCPDFVFEVFRFDTPVLTEVRAVTATAPARDRVLMEGSRSAGPRGHRRPAAASSPATR